jgi:hypothetical protein
VGRDDPRDSRSDVGRDMLSAPESGGAVAEEPSERRSRRGWVVLVASGVALAAGVGGYALGRGGPSPSVSTSNERPGSLAATPSESASPIDPCASWALAFSALRQYSQQLNSREKRAVHDLTQDRFLNTEEASVAADAAGSFSVLESKLGATGVPPALESTRQLMLDGAGKLRSAWEQLAAAYNSGSGASTVQATFEEASHLLQEAASELQASQCPYG